MPLLGETQKERLANYDKYIIANRAKTLTTFDQRGQTCGIYALAAALKTYNIAVPLIETRGELSSPTKDDSMRKVAKKLRITKIGELFDANEVTILAKQYGHDAEVRSVRIYNFFQTIRSAIDKNRLVMIPFNPKDSGLPDPSGGTDGGHWCLAIGYLEMPPTFKILVTHWDRFFDFDAGECQKSNANLKNFANAYYYKETTGGINTYSDLKDVLNNINTKINTYNKSYSTNIPLETIDQLALNPNKYFKNPIIKKVVNIPAVNLQLTLSKKIVII